MSKYLLSSIALFALAACNKDKTTTITTSEGDQVKVTADGNNNAQGGTITFEGKDGESQISFGDAAAKQGLPLGLPVYPGGEIKGAFMGMGGKDGGGMATVLTSATPAKVADFYKAEAVKRGFEVTSQSTSTTDNGSMASFTAKGANEQSLVVTATPDDKGGTAAVIIGGGKK